jgi:tRNA(fMet)-specific endonuclease VapC
MFRFQRMSARLPFCVTVPAGSLSQQKAFGTISSTPQESIFRIVTNLLSKTGNRFEMQRFMLDTNVCIRVLRDRPPSARARFNAEADGLCISTVTLGELFHGAAKSARPIKTRREVDRLTTRLAILPFDEDAAAHFGDIRADLERRGMVIEPYDLMIAGHARSRGLVIVTGNLSEFTRVDGLRCEDWLDPVQ